MGIIWRVQNSKGKGPYTGTEDISWMETDHNSWADHNHPCPPESFFEDASRNFGLQFGFTTRKKAMVWFSHLELARLRPLGFRLKRVEGRVIGSDKFQVWFLPSNKGIYNGY